MLVIVDSNRVTLSPRKFTELIIGLDMSAPGSEVILSTSVFDISVTPVGAVVGMVGRPRFEGMCEKSKVNAIITPYPKKTVLAPKAHTDPHAIGSPIRMAGTPSTNTVGDHPAPGLG
jgi:hypothetical protein